MRNKLGVLEGKKIALYGARKFGRIALNNLRASGMEPVCFVDDNAEMQHKRVGDIEVLSLQKALEMFGGVKDFVIVISHYYYDRALKNLNAAGIEEGKIIFFPFLLIDELDEVLFQKHKSEIEDVYDWLDDLKSKKILSAMIRSRQNLDISELAFLREDVQYFPTDIFHYEDEVMIDGGAFIGDTICSLQEVCHDLGKSLDKVYAFEPDEKNFSMLKNNKEIKCDMELYKAGMYSENTMLNFVGGEGGSSCIVENGEIEIETKTIDSIDFDKIPTFIKMDIEGCELEALRGGKETIKKYRPKLAICIYHKQSDIWEIPYYIKKLVPEYKLYIRNYTNWLDEIVLYATI